MTEEKSLEPVIGSFDIAVKWKEGTSPEKVKEIEEEFILPLNTDLMEDLNQIPQEVESITISRVK